MQVKIKSRKLLVFIIAFIVATGLLYLSKITGSEWVEFSKWALLSYVGGNVGEHFSNKPSELGAPK